MTVKPFLKTSIYDFVFCFLMALSLATVAGKGFYVKQTQLSNYTVTIIVIVIILAALFIMSYSKRNILIGIPAFLGVIAIAMIIAARNDQVSLFADKENNPYLFYMIIVIATVIVFLLSRKRLGNCILFLGGTITLALIQFLYVSNSLVFTLLFLGACGAMQIYRNYIYDVLHTQTLDLETGKIFLVSVIVSILVIAIGCGLFYSVIKPLNPPAKEIKIITKYLSLEILHKVGVANVETIENKDKTTSKTNDQKDDSKDTGKKSDESKGKNKKDKNKKNDKKEKSPSRMDDSKSKVFYAIKYASKIHKAIFIILLICLLIVGAILFKLYRRKKWYSSVMELPLEEQIKTFYHFYLKKFSKIGVKKWPEETPYEFAKRTRTTLYEFKNTGAEFCDLTEIFVKVEYGQEKITKKDYDSYLCFYEGFYKCCREDLGKIKYIVKFFSL